MKGRKQFFVSRWVGIDWDGRDYRGPSPEGTIYLEHSCDEWIVGTPDDAERMAKSLALAIRTARKILGTPKEGLLKKAEEAGWQYYCREHAFGTSEWYGDAGMIEHRKQLHGATEGHLI